MPNSYQMNGQQPAYGMQHQGPNQFYQQPYDPTYQQPIPGQFNNNMMQSVPYNMQQQAFNPAFNGNGMAPRPNGFPGGGYQQMSNIYPNGGVMGGQPWGAAYNHMQPIQNGGPPIGGGVMVHNPMMARGGLIPHHQMNIRPQFSHHQSHLRGMNRGYNNYNNNSYDRGYNNGRNGGPIESGRGRSRSRSRVSSSRNHTGSSSKVSDDKYAKRRRDSRSRSRSGSRRRHAHRSGRRSRSRSGGDKYSNRRKRSSSTGGGKRKRSSRSRSNDDSSRRRRSSRADDRAGSSRKNKSSKRSRSRSRRRSSSSRQQLTDNVKHSTSGTELAVSNSEAKENVVAAEPPVNKLSSSNGKSHRSRESASPRSSSKRLREERGEDDEPTVAIIEPSRTKDQKKHEK